MMSDLVTVYTPSPHHKGSRPGDIDRITIHCTAGQCTAEQLGRWFQRAKPVASCNYGIDQAGRVLCSVTEDLVSMCSSSYANDCRAVTIEVSSEAAAPNEVNRAAWDRLLELVTDICRRNGKTRLLWIPDSAKALARQQAPEEMLLTVHRWYANKACPGDWLFSRMGYIAEEVTRRLSRADDIQIYNSLAELPEWAIATIAKLVKAGVLKGTEDGLELSRDMCRILVVLDRLGVLDHGE